MTPRVALARNNEDDPMLLAQISDLHIKRPGALA